MQDHYLNFMERTVMVVLLLVIISDPFGNKRVGLFASIISTEILHFGNGSDE